MPLPRGLLLLFGICFPLGAAPPLALHGGSTREWVKLSGMPVDSLRYHLEFLDSTEGLQVFEAPVYTEAGSMTTFVHECGWTDWRVRITIPDSPAVEDTAVLRVIQARRFAPPNPGAFPNTEIWVKDLALWIQPSVHFPLDVQANPTLEALHLSAILEAIPGGDGLGPGSVYRHLFTGSWQTDLTGSTGLEDVGFAPDLEGRWHSAITVSLAGTSWFASPWVDARKDLGAVSWVGGNARWELRRADGIPVPSGFRGGSPFLLEQGETWTYRDTLRAGEYPAVLQTGSVHLTLLESASDSAGWTRLSVRQSTRPDSGSPSSSDFTLRFAPHLLEVRTGSDSGTPWNLPSSFVGLWGLGLMEKVSPYSSARIVYSQGAGSSWGEAMPESNSHWYGVSLAKDSGAVSMRDEGESLFLRIRQWSQRTWTLQGHALDSGALGTSHPTPRPRRDLRWVREHLNRHPGTELVRILPDGTRSTGRGAQAMKLLQRRGMAILQVRDGSELVTLRVIQP